MPELVEAIRAANLTGKPQRIEFSARLPAPRWSEAFVAPVGLGGHGAGRAGVVVVTVHDLTPIRRAEEHARRLRRQCQPRAAHAACGLTGFIDTLQGPARDDPAARERFLGIMQAQAWRMARLIDDLLSLSRIELRAHQRPDTPVDLVAIVRQVADGLQTLARDRGRRGRDQRAGRAAGGARRPRRADATVREPDRERPEIWRQRQARRYRADVRRRDAAARARRVVSVRDYGPGIAAEHLPRLTERFYRVDVGESRAQGGTGLGLALVKHILNRHSGRLTIDSKAGEGATFTVRLPLHSCSRCTEVNILIISTA